MKLHHKYPSFPLVLCLAILPLFLSAQQTVAEIKPYNGVPTMFLNGTPHSGATLAYFKDGKEECSLFESAGITVYQFTYSPTAAFWTAMSRGETWQGPDDYDFTALDDKVAELLAIDPDAYIMPRLLFRGPLWWLELYSSEIECYDDGSGIYKPLPFQHAKDGQAVDDATKPKPSWASEKWRADNRQAVRRMIQHIEASDYCDRFIGYFLGAGRSQEWFNWESSFYKEIATGFSSPTIKGFQQWLKAKYGTIGSLNRAWSVNHTSFEAILPPGRDERNCSLFGTLRHPEKEIKVLDYLHYNSDMVAETIIDLAGALKEATDRKKIVGAFYGYVNGLAGEPRQQLAGHNALDMILRSEDIDFLSSPHMYWEFRNLGTGTPAIMSLQESIYLHGKYWFSETDLRTSLTTGHKRTAEEYTISDDILQQRRNTAFIATKGLGHWWFNVGGIRYNNAELMAAIGECVQISEQAKNYDRSPVDEVAFVVDTKGPLYSAIGDPLSRLAIRSQIHDLTRFGGVAGQYCLSDLDHISDRKVFVFPNLIATTNEVVEQIEKLKGGNRILMFTYAAGIFHNGRIDLKNMEELTGIRFKMADSLESMNIEIVPQNGKYSELNGLSYNNYENYTAAPVFIPRKGKGVKVLGKTAHGQPALVIKEYEDYTVVFCAMPRFHHSVLRAFARNAGVHIYSESGDCLYATKEVIAMSTDKGETKKIILPEKRKVIDAFGNKLLSNNADTLIFHLEDKETKLFFLE